LERLHDGVQGRFGMKVSSTMGVKEEAGAHVDDMKDFHHPAFVCPAHRRADFKHPESPLAIPVRARGAPAAHECGEDARQSVRHV
jgi:hypothetical protein